MIYDPVTDTWEKGLDMPTARRLLSANAVNGKIYAIGGSTAANIPLSTVEEYDPATDTWVKKADIPTPRNGLSTSTIKGRIYAIGGTRPADGSPVEVYTPEDWQSVSPQGKLPTKWAEVKSD